MLGSEDELVGQQFFIMAERKAIPCESFLHAVDVCFKLYTVMNASWPSQCKDIWEFIQSFVYKLKATKISHAALVHFVESNV